MITLKRDITGNLDATTTREWLVTNGIGGFACGTLSGVLTRRYHGLLVAAMKPPVDRRVLVSKVDDIVIYKDRAYELFANKWAKTESILPSGPDYLHGFRLEGTTPVWTYQVDDAVIEKRVWMTYGQNTTTVAYAVVEASAPVLLSVKVLVNDRDMHTNTHAAVNDDMPLTVIENGVQVRSKPGGVPFYLTMAGAECTLHHTWYRDYLLDVEVYRGFDPLEDTFHAATFTVTLNAHDSTSLILSTDADAHSEYDEHQLQEQTLADQSEFSDTPDWIHHLVLAADQFIVRRDTEAVENGRSVIAGYHWFADWGRDTMIALPGLTLTTGRHDEAAAILRTFGQYVDRGMIPNRFPDSGEEPEYNTVDATLWYFEAIRAYVAATDDRDLLGDLFPTLTDIIKHHVQGTRHNIHMDPDDGLLYAGAEGLQLTWMDAKVGDWVVTPRTGKAVEINALWYNALRTIADFADRLGEDAKNYGEMADRVHASFSRFWNAERGYCFDVIDGPDGDEPSLRPNQLFAISSPQDNLLTDAQARAVVDVCAKKLVTPRGLRSLGPEEPDYVGVYEGDYTQRDGSYHQGTVWGWLIGPFVSAHFRVYADREAARAYLEPFAEHLLEHCVGSVAEIFDGDPPHKGRGAVAQAWSVAEILRCWAI